MKWLKNNWKILALGVLSVLLFKQCNKDPEYIEVPFKVEVPVPVVEVQFDTVYYPIPVKPDDGIKEIDSTYIKKWEELKNNSVAKDSLFKKAIEINEYKETVEDDTLTINLGLKVRGELLNYNVGYKTKPRTVTLDTVLKVEIPKKPMVFFGADVVLPTNPLNSSPSIAPGAIFIPKNNKSAWKLNYDIVNKTVNAGYYWKF